MGWHIYINQTLSVLRKFIKYGMNESGNIDMEKGIRETATVEISSVEPRLFEKGIISQKEVERVIAEALVGIDDVNPMLKDFIFDMVKWAKVQDESILTPMIYSLAYKYHDHKPLIDKMFREFDVKNKDDALYIEAFANILVSPKLYNDIIGKEIKSASATETMKLLEKGIEVKWEEFTQRLTIQQKKIDTEELPLLRSQLKSIKDYSLQQEIKQEIADAVERLKTIEKALSSKWYKDSYMRTNGELLMLKISKDNLIARTNNFAFAGLVLEGKNIAIGNIKDRIEETFKVRSIIDDMSIEDREVVSGFLDEVKASTSMEKQKELLERPFEGKIWTVTDYIKAMIIKKWDEFQIYDSDAVVKMITNFTNGIFDHEFVLKNNPVSKAFSAFTSDANLGQNRRINEAIMTRYGVSEQKINKEDFVNKFIGNIDDAKLNYTPKTLSEVTKDERVESLNNFYELNKWKIFQVKLPSHKWKYENSFPAKFIWYWVTQDTFAFVFETKLWKKIYFDWGQFDSYSWFWFKKINENDNVYEWLTMKDILNTKSEKWEASMSADELYHEWSKFKDKDGKTFKDMIDSLRANSEKWVSPEGWKNFESFIRDIVKDADFKVQTNKTTTTELENKLIDDLINWIPGREENWVYIPKVSWVLNDGELIRQFKAIANRTKTDADINLSVVKKDDYNKEIKLKGAKYNERVLILDQMVDTEMKVKFIRGLDGHSFKNIDIEYPEISKKWKEYTATKNLKKYFDEHFESKFVKAITEWDIEAQKQHAMFTSAEMYKFVMRVVNGTLKESDNFTWIKIKDLRDQIMNRLHIPPV